MDIKLLFIKQAKHSLKIPFISLILTLSLLQPWIVLGCGLSMVAVDNSWTYGDDSAEQSFINFENGEEKLIISRKFTNESVNTVWVIPVPATPDTVKIDVLSDIPVFSGYGVSEHAKRNVEDIRDFLVMSQFYPIIPWGLYSLLTSTTGMSGDVVPTAMPGFVVDGYQDVSVHQHLEKEGMVVEVLSASNSDSLYEYLNKKGLKVEKNSISILRDYIGNDFSFIASWVSPSAEKDSTKGLLMTFPTEEIFYPLKPESGTPGEGMPETITVVGHVTPRLFDDIKESTNVNYYYSKDRTSLKDFFSSNNGFGFTKIIIDVKPSKLTQDLYISKNPPLRILNAQLINLYTFVYGLILMIIISSVSTYIGIRSLFSSGKEKPNCIKLSMFNCLTIIGIIYSSKFLPKEMRTKYIIRVSLTIVVLTLASCYLLSLLYA